MIAMKKLLYIIILIETIAACTPSEKRFKIGVSQCSADIWREKQNAELRMGAYIHGDVDVRFAAAYDSDERQVQQIDSLVATGIDLLIVAPNQVQTISPAIDRAYDRGIPVIVFERKTSSKKYTAYLGADNYEMGRTMGEHIAHSLGGRGRVLEIHGLEGSSPAIERHNGFADAMKQYPDIQVVATLQGDWTEHSAHEAVQQWLQSDAGRQQASAGIDYVFGHNDRMAIGARKALESLLPTASLKATRYCGIDGLPGPEGGIQQVIDSLLDATYIYPTHGDRLISLAVAILEGRPYNKEELFMSALVTKSNAHVIKMQNEEVAEQTAYLDQLHMRADNYLQELNTQRIIIVLACGAIVLLLVVFTLFYLYQRGKITLRRQRVVSNLWNLEPQEPAEAAGESTAVEAASSGAAEPQSTEPQSAEPQIAEPQSVEPAVDDRADAEPVDADEATADIDSTTTSHFVARFKEVVESRLPDSELSVEDLAADMHLSRVQLYRKLKTITGSSPVELLRTARLNRGYQLLLSTDKTISEVAYAVGFTAPSYFTKCFKDEFGQSPTELKQ